MGKGKQATKGAKQIVEENAITLSFYRNMGIISSAMSLIVLVFFYSTAAIALFIFAGLVYISSYQFMIYMAKPKYTDSGQLIDSGVDLNMEGGITEHIKDIIILTALCQLLAAMLTNYVWWFWLLAPFRGFWIFWKTFLSPSLGQQEPLESENNDKKQKKLERRMKRHH